MASQTTITWAGPFPNPAVWLPERPSFGSPITIYNTFTGSNPGGSATVLSSSATALWQSDPTWWQIG